MALVSLPKSLTDGSTAYGSDVRANDDAIVAQVNGNLDDSNIKTTAAIQGTKLSNVAGSRVPGDRIEDDAVTADKLRDDATVDANRAVTTNHLRDSCVTTAKIASANVSSSRIKFTTDTWVPGGTLASATTTWHDVGIQNPNRIVLVALEFAAGATPAGTVADQITMLGPVRNTTSGKFWVGLRNHSNTGANLVGVSVVTYYVQS